MKIVKFKNGNLNLKLEPDYDKSKYSNYTLDELLNNSELFMNDLYFRVDGGGALWLLDYNKNLAYAISTYMFNPNYWVSLDFFKDLLDEQMVKLKPYGTINKVREFFHEDEI